MHVEPLYVSHNGRVINMEALPASIDSQFMHCESLHVWGSGAPLYDKWTVVSDNTKYPVYVFAIAWSDHKQELSNLSLIG